MDICCDWRRLAGFVLFLGPALSLFGARALYILDEWDQPHLVTKVTDQEFFYGPAHSERVSLSEARTILADSKFRIPGYIHVRKEEAIIHTFTAQGRTQVTDVIHISFEIDIRPNRDFEETFILLTWIRNDGDEQMVACPLGELKANRTRKRIYNLSVEDSFRNSRYSFMFMSGGLSIPHSSLDMEFITPMDHYREKMAGKPIPDGGPKLLNRIVPRQVTSKGDASEVLPGRVVLNATIDRNGYVTAVSVAESSGPAFTENAMEVVQLWEFKPTIKDGKAVESDIRIPIRFGG